MSEEIDSFEAFFPKAITETSHVIYNNMFNFHLWCEPQEEDHSRTVHNADRCMPIFLYLE